LTDLLRKDSFKWSERVEQAFNALKEAMTIPPVLGMLDFTKTFIIECDALCEGIRAVLMQAG
jgi:hypothetical protein